MHQAKGKRNIVLVSPLTDTMPTMRRGFVLVLCGLALAGSIFTVAYNSYASSTIHIETRRLPVLLPHEHGEGDSPSDEGHHQEIQSAIWLAPEDLWLTSFDFDLKNAPDAALHHAILVRTDARSLTCPNVERELAVAGQDQMHNPHIILPDGYGIFIPKDTPLLLHVALHNPLPPIGSGEVYEDVSLRLRMQAIPAREAEGYTHADFLLLHLDENPCDGSYAYTVPSHATNHRFTGNVSTYDPSRYTFSATSTIVYMGGHLHGWQGGKMLTLMNNDKKHTEFATVRSSRGENLFDTPHYPASIQFAPGDTVSIEAFYSNPGSVPIRGAMGIWGAHVVLQSH